MFRLCYVINEQPHYYKNYLVSGPDIRHELALVRERDASRHFWIGSSNPGPINTRFHKTFQARESKYSTVSVLNLGDTSLPCSSL